jgi:hypothetical protein
MSKYTFIFFIIVFIVIICSVSVYYNFGAKNVVDTDLTNEIIATPVPTNDINNDYTGRDVNTNSNNTNNSNNKKNDVNTNTYTYTNEFGSGDKTTTVKAKQVEQLSGFSGASNNVFYIDANNDLYYLELTNLVKTKLASNVNHMDNNDGRITAYFEHPHDVYEENKFVTYKEM